MLKRLFNLKKSTFLSITFAFVILFNSIIFLGFGVNSATYDQQKKEIETKKSDLAKNLSKANDDLEDVSQLSNTLSGEITRKNQKIEESNQNIVKIDSLITELDKQSEVIQSQRVETVNQIKSVLVEMQKEPTPLHAFLSSQSLGDALSKFYSFSVLQEKADDYRLKLEETEAELEKNKQDQLKTKEQQEIAKGLLIAEKSSLVELKTKTQNDEAKYQQMRNSLIEQNSKLEAKLAEVESSRKKEIAEQEARRLQQEEENRKRRANERTVVSNPGGGSSGGTDSDGPDDNDTGSASCWYEEGRALNVPSGYFGSPANGSLTRAFSGCSHDGADIANDTGTELHAVASGVVVHKGSYDVSGYGIYVVVKHNLPSGQTVYSQYSHMLSESPRSVGETVAKGAVVGRMGCTGLCYGTHVHFMLYSDTYGQNGPGCRLGSSKCYNPTKVPGIL